MRQRAWLILLAGVLVTGVSCSRGIGISAPTFKMGEQVPVGPFIYTVLDAEWTPHLGELLGGKVPSHRFLVVRISVTNSGGTDAAVPTLALEDGRGQLHPEVMEIKEMDEWLGMFRTIRPAQTEQGKIVFDVPAGGYKLRLTDEGELGNEKVALVEIPFRTEVTVPGAAGTAPRQ